MTLDKPGASPGQQSSGTSGDVPRSTPTSVGEPTGEDYFSGEETVQGVIDELKDKEGG